MEMQRMAATRNGVERELEALRHSPFFESLDPVDVSYLIEHARPCSFDPGDRLLTQGAPAETLYLLVRGEVELSFRRPTTEDVSLRTISDPGYPVGWSVMVTPFRYRATATARSPVRAVALSRELLERHARERPAFSYALMQRILWALGRRLREARMRLVIRHYEREAYAIRALLDQSASNLPVTSALHKIPHYLENRLTISDAFEVLELVHTHGVEREQFVAGLCLELLRGVRREISLFQHLQRIYELVAGAPEAMSSDEVNRACMEETVRLFQGIPHVVEGREHLPEEPGNLFVMNHLNNHADYLLPNHFHFTFDTHFVSASLLYQHYGEPPIRVVRKARPAEYGHQRYYDHLGHLYVYSWKDEVERRLRRQLFLEDASAHLRAGKNVVICPSGDSTSTELSPLPFRTGAFHLAHFTRPEPRIVPIAVAHFDKKITRRRPVAVVHEPFYLSDYLGATPAAADFVAFADGLRDRFSDWVRQAGALSGDFCLWP